MFPTAQPSHGKSVSRRTGWLCYTDQVLGSDFEKRFGRRRSDALQLHAGETRFVVSQISGAMRRPSDAGVGQVLRKIVAANLKPERRFIFSKVGRSRFDLATGPKTFRRLKSLSRWIGSATPQTSVRFRPGLRGARPSKYDVLGYRFSFA